MKNYKNKCELENEACEMKEKSGKILEVDYRGKCCEWKEDCEGDNVCGSDGKTYLNYCHLKYTACVMRKKYMKKLYGDYMGACKAMCMSVCPTPFKPVCGSNGLTYSNKCFLDSHKCILDKMGVDFEMKHRGACFSNCKMDKKCSRAFKPVCGTDGQTYPNECVLKVYGCLAMRMGKVDKKLKVSFEGECPNSCIKTCSHMYEPVCGSNGKTYLNKCSLNIANCILDEDDTKITMVSEGVCKNTCIDACPAANYEVCGTDGRTYPSPCALAQAACRLKSAGVGKELKMEHTGYCMSSCERVCPPKRMAVCGTDWNTYPSACHLNQAACIKYKKMKAEWENLEKEGNQEKMKNYTKNGWQPLQVLTVGECRLGSLSIGHLMKKCDKELEPICGCDGKTYANKCELMITNVMNLKMMGKGVTPLHGGVCIKH